MAKRKEIEPTDAGAAAQPKADLPQVESPSLSPAESVPASKPAEQPAPFVETAPAPSSKPSFQWSPRRKRTALFAASVTLAAALGAVVGASVSHSFADAKAPTEVAGVEERRAMQQSIARLTKEVVSLKANLDAASKTARSEIAKIADRLAAAADVTGSVTPPQTMAATPEEAIPLPVPRPRRDLAMSTPPPAVVPEWTIRSAHDGVAYVEGHGEIYEAVLGVPLPGLGPVQTIKREDGRWIVVTPRGIIVSSRDRHYFE